MCLITQCAPVHTQTSHSGLQEQRGQTQPSMHSSMQPPSFRALSPRRSLLCPLGSINVMVHQWWSTLSRGRTPLLI